MSIIKGNKKTTVTYEIKPEDIKRLIAQDLEVPESEISVDFVIQEVGGDPMDRFPGVKTVTKIRITHTK